MILDKRKKKPTGKTREAPGSASRLARAESRKQKRGIMRIGFLLSALFVIFIFRQSGDALRLISSLILLGVFLHVVWLIAPAFGSGAIVAALIAVVAIIGLGLCFSNRVAVGLRGGAHAE